ncbi:hypothetical protein DFH06DRAFT_3260 [Mycena polygramma]|nr:hypothetical protein DFH06DRAFT_3260 [Mycena polygramma]
MPSSASRAIAKGLGTFAECVAIVLCLPCILCLMCAGGGVGKCGTMAHKSKNRKPTNPRKIPRSPPPLPTSRIEIRPLPMAEQPQSCHFLKLPLELRECIYEHLLGGRLITLMVLGFPTEKYALVRSQCRLAIDHLAHDPIERSLPADRISPALLRSCRQVYFEALRILHQRNTFHFKADQLETIVRSGLGYYCLPAIRSVYIYHTANAAPFGRNPWTRVFTLLQQMNLERVAFKFAAGPEVAGPSPHSAVLDSPWGRGVLAVRNLRRLEVWFQGNPPDEKGLVKTLQRLMIAPGADEKYRTFLEKH